MNWEPATKLGFTQHKRRIGWVGGMNQGKLVVRCVKSVLELLELWNVYVMSQAWLLSQCKLHPITKSDGFHHRPMAQGGGASTHQLSNAHIALVRVSFTFRTLPRLIAVPSSQAFHIFPYAGQ